GVKRRRFREGSGSVGSQLTLGRPAHDPRPALNVSVRLSSVPSPPAAPVPGDCMRDHRSVSRSALPPALLLIGACISAVATLPPRPPHAQSANRGRPRRGPTLSADHGFGSAAQSS